MEGLEKDGLTHVENGKEVDLIVFLVKEEVGLDVGKGKESSSKTTCRNSNTLPELKSKHLFPL